MPSTIDPRDLPPPPRYRTIPPPVVQLAITTTEQAEAAVDAACDVLIGTRRVPTRLLVSVAMHRLLGGSGWARDSGRRYLLNRAPHDFVLSITVTSTNPDVAFVTAYSE